jgi:hypothetical protein
LLGLVLIIAPDLFTIRKILLLIWHVVLCSIWMARNYGIFNNMAESLAEVVDKIQVVS